MSCSKPIDKKAKKPRVKHAPKAGSAAWFAAQKNPQVAAWTRLIVNVKKGRQAETKKGISELVERMRKEIEKAVRLEMTV